MVKRYICISCGLSFRKDRKCDNCGDPLSAIDIDHTVYGILMYVLAGIALFMILMAFMGIGLLALLAFLPLAIAVGFNEIDDHEMDKVATGIARGGGERLVR